MQQKKKLNAPGEKAEVDGGAPVEKMLKNRTGTKDPWVWTIEPRFQKRPSKIVGKVRGQNPKFPNSRFNEEHYLTRNIGQIKKAGT